MSTNEASYDGAVDEFLGETAGTEEEVEAPKPTKAQPKAEKPAAKTEKAPAKPAAGTKPAEVEDDSEDSDDEGEETAPKPAKDGPWKASLAERGIDTPEVNQYMAEVVQPYITRLEQSGGEISGMFEGDAEAASIASGILNDLGENPAKTIASLITLLDIDDNEINAALEAAGIETPEGQQQEQAPEGEVDQENETPEQKWVRERMEAEQHDEESKAYDAFMKQLGDEFGEGFDETLFSMALASAGDIEGAMQLYPVLAEKYAGPATKPAPPVMGGGRRPGQAPQPVAKRYDGSNQGWEGAMDDFFSEENARKGR